MTAAPLRVLLAPETFNLGETSRAVEVAAALESMGHETLVVGYSTRFADYVRNAGLELRLLQPELTDRQADQMLAVDQGRGVRHPFTTKMVRQRVDSELEMIRSWRPDCVVIGTTFTQLISARAAGVPLVYVRPYPMSRGHLALMESFPVLHGSGRLATGVNRTAARLVRSVAGSLRWKPASFRTVAAEHRVSLPTLTLEAIDGDLNLIASLFPYIDGRPLADGEIAVGPVFAQPPGILPDAVTQLAGLDRPVVYVGLGSSARRRLALDILRGVAEADVEVVTTAGRYLTDDDRAALPTNVQVHDFLPAHLLAGVVDASVIHGGEGTVQTACASGAPFAGIGLQMEQRHNIDECVRNGNALRLSRSDIRRGRLPAVVRQLLTDPDLRQAARRLRPLTSPGGARRGAEAIVDLVRGGTARARSQD